MLCLKKRRTYSFTQGVCAAIPRRSKKDNNNYEGSLNMAIMTLPRKNRSREERPSRMVLTVTEDTPADMLAGSMELLVQLPRDHHLHTQRVTVLRSTPMMDLLVQIATAHKLTASNYTLQAMGEHGLILSHHPNTPIGALDVLQVKLLPKQGTCVPRKTKQANQPFETTFRLQVHLPRNQLYVSRVSPKMNLGEILNEVCREKNLDKNNYELRHPTNLEEILDLSLSLQDYHLQEVTLYAKQAKGLGPTLSTQDIMALQRQEERRRQQTKQSVFGFMFKKSKESSLSTDSLGGRSVSPARSDETARSASPLQPPTRPQRKRRPAPKPPTNATIPPAQSTSGDNGKDKIVINHSRNSSDSSGYHEASVLSDNPDLAARLPETLPRRSKAPGMSNTSRKLAQTSQSSKSLSNLVMTGGTLSRGISSTSLSSTGLRKKRAAPPPPTPRPLSSAISTQALERIVDSEESLTSDMDPSKPPSDIGAPSKASSDIDCPKANSDIAISTQSMLELNYEPKSKNVTYEFDDNIQQNCIVKTNVEACSETDLMNYKLVKADTEMITPVEVAPKVEQARIITKRVGEPVPLPMPRKVNTCKISASEHPKAPKRKMVLPLAPPRILSMERDHINNLSHERENSEHITHEVHCCISNIENTSSLDENDFVKHIKPEEIHSKLKVDSAFINEDQIAQEETTSKIDDIIDDSVSLKSSQYPNHKMESNFELYNSNCMKSILINPEVQFVSKDKFLNENKIKKKKISDIVDNEEDHELNLNQHLNNEENTGLNPDSIQLNVSQEKLLLLEHNVIFKKEEDNFLQRDYKVKSENINLRNKNENQDNKSYILLSDDSLNKSIIKPNGMTELKNEQLEPSYHQSVCQRPPRTSRKKISYDEIKENIETKKYLYSTDATSDTEIKSDFEKNKEMCTVISTIPKCDHFDVIKEDDTLNSIIKYSIAENVNELCQKLQTGQNVESNNNMKNAKRAKVIRSQSKSDDFEMDNLKRQKRYLTSPPEDIAHALNLNLSTRNLISSSSSKTEQEQIDAEHCINHTRDVDVNERVTGNQDVPSETDILLQKVSDTLSNVLPSSLSPIPASSSPLETSLPPKMNHSTVQANVVATHDDSTVKSEFIDIKNESNESYKSCIDLPENNLSASTPNITSSGLQENTSDYVSAISEDLSISDWEYQLPAPPSAFRDSHSPAFDDYDTVTLGSVEAFKEPLENPVVELINATDSNNKNMESTKNLLNSSETNFEFQKALIEKTNFAPEAKVDKRIVSESVEQKSIVSHKTKVNTNFRKEIISELENKIETGTLAQSINKDFDRKNLDNLSTPKIAPVDNTLSNFTITTYTKQKSLDIFEEFEESNNYARNSDDRFIKTFATLSRNKGENYDKKSMTKNMHLINNIPHDKKITIKSEESNFDCKTEPKNQNELIYRLQSLNEKTNEKTNIQRSKSYISISSNAKYQTEKEKIRERKHESQVEQKIIDIKKSTSITDLNVDILRGSEKFSQWRDNMLKHQKEPSKENQLQSLQVLKNILPQLKNAQQAEKMSKEHNNVLIEEKYEPESNEYLTKLNVISTHESKDLEPECKQLSKEQNMKRYVYTGPPAISLGSWSERPSVNVQIKMDTDYKLGKNNSNTTVNINRTKNEKDIANYASNVNQNNIAKHEIKINSSTNSSKNSDELTRKLIAHTTASGFKIPMTNRVNAFDSTKNKDRPFVMGVELKKTFIEVPKETSKNSENEIDTSINFKELTNTFDQYMNFKQKPKRANINKHSANCDIQLDNIERIAEPNAKQNGHAKSTKASNQNDFSSKNQWMHDIQENSQTKKFTSIVGVNGTSQNFRPQNETSLKYNINKTVKINPPMPVVKGFKIPITDFKMNNNQIKHNELSTIDGSDECMQPPKFPTMPVITGVTLKNASAKSKSIPVQLDSRDILLESIRNFGGREKLKSIAGKY